ncbi:MAG: hypothetical protein ACLT46_04020 [Hungatella sp.]
MNFTGRFIGGLRIDMESRRIELTIQSDRDDIGSEWDRLRKNEKLVFSVKPYKKKRSLDANAYYWQLLTKLAEKVQISKPHMHNLMLRRYGQTESVDGKLVHLVLPESEQGERLAEESGHFHIRPTSQVKEGMDGRMYRTYVMLRGSSTYDTAEMSHLIDGLVSECQDQGIETLPPEELERMMALYDKKWRKHHEEVV